VRFAYTGYKSDSAFAVDAHLADRVGKRDARRTHAMRHPRVMPV
jgi:hypothetical protein